MTTLQLLQERVAERAESIVSARGAWFCREGCDGCCRSLANIPRMTEPEWKLLSEAIAALPGSVREEVIERAAALSPAQRPIQCPMLNPASGKCLVYEARPLACRTYGFYRERDNGIYCGIISAQVDSGALDDVVWGNHAAVTSAQQALGPEHDLLYWMK